MITKSMVLSWVSSPQHTSGVCRLGRNSLGRVLDQPRNPDTGYDCGRFPRACIFYFTHLGSQAHYRRTARGLHVNPRQSLHGTYRGHDRVAHAWGIAAIDQAERLQVWELERGIGLTSITTEQESILYIERMARVGEGGGPDSITQEDLDACDQMYYDRRYKLQLENYANQTANDEASTP